MQARAPIRLRRSKITPDTRARPAVTVITATRNAAATLEQTLESVRRQTWPVEHVVVDGGSTDGTLALLERGGARLRWISEVDRGLYDAMNKGLAMRGGRNGYILFLNADDTFYADDAVERVMTLSSGEDVVYGRLERDDEELGYRDVIGGPTTTRDMVLGMRCHHQAIFARGRVFDAVGGFDLRYRIAADYDWVVRVFRRDDVSKRFVPVVVSTMRRGGLSDRHYLAAVRERRDIVRRHYPPAERIRFELWSPFGDILRHYTERALRRAGLLNAARRALQRLGRRTAPEGR